MGLYSGKSEAEQLRPEAGNPYHFYLLMFLLLNFTIELIPLVECIAVVIKFSLVFVHLFILKTNHTTVVLNVLNGFVVKSLHDCLN